MDMSYMDEFEATNFMLMEDNATMYDIIEAPTHNMSYYHHSQQQQQQQELEQQYQSTIEATTTTVDSSINPINSNDDNDEKYDDDDENDADNDELIKNNSHANVECLANVVPKSDRSDVAADKQQLVA